jgi:MFS family permease
MDTKRFSLDTTLTLIAAYLGLFVGLIDANAINLALPAIRDNLGGGISGAQWTIDAYNITFAAVLLTAGSLGDRFGRRTLLRLGWSRSSPRRWPARRPRRCRCCWPPVRCRALARQ